MTSYQIVLRLPQPLNGTKPTGTHVWHHDVVEPSRGFLTRRERKRRIGKAPTRLLAEYLFHRSSAGGTMQRNNLDNESQIDDLLLKIARRIPLTDRETDLLQYIRKLSRSQPWPLPQAQGAAIDP